MCDLCNVENKEWEEEGFFAVECRVCCVPMIVLVAHRATLSEIERATMERLTKKYWPDKKLRNIGMRSIPTHWHEHLID